MKASRNFVCIRVATYESKEEAEFMKSVYKSRSGALENTTFGILSPDGKESLVRAGRGPMHAFRSARQMASAMDEIAAKYKAKDQFKGPNVPVMESVDVGLNVAACDSLPFVVTVGKDNKQQAEINKSMVDMVWSDKIAGQYVYATTTNRKDLKPFSGVKEDSAILIVGPGQFGLTGDVLASFPADVEPAKLKGELEKIAIANKHVRKNDRSHTSMGIGLGIEWKTEIPETDAQSVRARERARGR